MISLWVDPIQKYSIHQQINGQIFLMKILQ
jgi:hypothetical protein